VSSDDRHRNRLDEISTPIDLGQAPASLRPQPATSNIHDDAPHYHGHRQRLRQKIINNGSETLADYELLELLLMLAIPRKDVKPLAKDLIRRFGSFTGIITASVDDLMAVTGVKENTVAAIKTVNGAATRMLKGHIQDRPVFTAWQAVIDYCLAAQSHCDIEQFRILFLDTKKHLIADEVLQQGTINHTPVYIREAVKRALELKAHSLVMVHNHPSGDPTPSPSDIQTTVQMKSALATMDISLLDHIIVSSGRYTSLRQENLI